MALQEDRRAGSGSVVDRWELIKEILDRALDIKNPRQRAAFLDRTCGDEAAVRREVESLLAEEARLGDFLARPIFSLHGPPAGGEGAGDGPDGDSRRRAKGVVPSRSKW